MGQDKPQARDGFQQQATRAPTHADAWFMGLLDDLAALEVTAASRVADAKITIGAISLVPPDGRSQSRKANFDLTVSTDDHSRTFTFMACSEFRHNLIIPLSGYTAPHTEVPGAPPGYYFSGPWCDMFFADLQANFIADYQDRSIERILGRTSAPAQKHH